MKSKGFVYKARSAEAVQRRATQSGGDYDTFFDSRFQKFTPEGGQNYVRILPPTWDNAEHFGLDYYLHSNVGPDNSQYLCLERNAELAQLHGVEGGRCPVCEERRVLEREGETEEANQLKGSRRIGVWVIDRNNEKDGPKFWDMSWTMDKDIAALQINKRTGEALLIDDPDAGYDFEFVREGKGLNTRYLGKQISRQPSPATDDDRQLEAWLDFITANPIPDVLNFYSYDYIAKVFSGKKTEKTETTDEPPPRRTREVARRVELKKQDDDEEEPVPQQRRRAKVEEEDEEEAPSPRRQRAKVEQEDEDEEVSNGAQQEKPQQRQRAKVAATEDEEEEDVPVPSSFRERMAKVNERNVRR
jgi:hypothetical protein